MEDKKPLSQNQKSGQKPKRRWLRGILWTFLVLAVLVGIFYQAILFGIVKIVVGRIEKSEKMQIAYELNGSIFTSLELKNVKVRVLEPGPLEKVTLGRLALRYHPWDAFRRGLPELVESIELKDLVLELDATHPSPPKPKKPKKESSGPISIPFPKLVDLRGITVRVKTPTGLLNVDNANFSLLPDQAGVLAVDKLEIPGFRNFQNLRATTTYRDRNLILEDLALADNLVVQKLQVDASKIGEQALSGGIQAQTFGGQLNAEFFTKTRGKTNDIGLTADLGPVDVAQALAFVGKATNPAAPAPDPAVPPADPAAPPPPKASGTLDQLHLKIAGEADDLSTWNGDLKIVATKPTVGTTVIDNVTVNAVITQGQVTFSDTSVTRGRERATLTGTAQLPGRDVAAKPLLADVALSAEVPDLSSVITDGAGSAKLDLLLKARPTLVDASLTANLTALAVKTLALDSAQITAHFQKSGQTQIDWKQPWWTNTAIDANIAAKILKISGYQIDAINTAVKSSNENLRIEALEILRGKNAIRSEGTFVFQEKPEGPLPGALDLNLKIDGPALAEFSIDPETPIISGEAQGTGKIVWESKNPTANLALKATNLIHEGVALGELNLDAQAENGLAQITNLHLQIPGDSFIQVTGQFDLTQQNDYGAQVSVKLTDLAHFKPLMGKAMADKPLAGALQLDYNGTGQLKDRRHEGRVALYATNCTYAELTGINFQASGFYTPTLADFPIIKLETSKGNLATAISYSEKTLKITNLELAQNKEIRLAGNLTVPLDLEQIANSEKRLPLDAPIAIDLVGKNVELGGIQTDLGMTPQATGKFSIDLKAKGSLRNLDALLALNVRDLKTEKAKELQPVSADLNLAIANQRAQLSGTIKEASIQPIALSGNIPLDLASIISTGSVNPNLPINARVVLPPTNLGIVKKYVSAINGIDGTLGLDVTVEGTLGKPRFLGGLKTNVRTIDFGDSSVPDIRDLTANLDFKNNVLTLSEVKGDLAGGPFNARGSINLTNPKEPTFDIGLQGKSILLVRNDSVIVRSNFDLTLKGPLAAAEVGGTIGITDSRFFREIDILPINLPGRPAPSVAGKKSTLSFPNPPLRDWKFNVAIKTDDAFKITGNLANGEVLVGLTFGGTGLAPTLDGNVQIYKLRASLPFSNFDIQEGNIYFSKDLPPLSPVLDLRGKSTVRDYEIEAYIWGDSSKPQTLFLSQPPLTQEDILTLLATGVTQSEIAENPQLLAGRAGSLFIQQLYSKIFKRKKSFEQSPLSDRLDVQIGNVDPKTGRESATARLKITDKWQVLADLDITGGVRGQVRYLLRFK